ncbi:MAG: hypothetical protein KatS3mg038_3556 [Candidatus Kapaibacterium sp.]|nr:MAG: hypothetical protein KatS3mg038_1262 [Candidatus Kapabacteria bacterium]GIV51339.1 MAG: hypothetical protein KatS3mg038_1860 [Candidatus Kapabacteria bacterium]GIV52463.1 MAG: hypothetical protein KatS3mg038_2984 [Candidatus Kapabacteria bacterium]GIV53035.1 MAG: hypothetical protein KatS3mg038_3556 [Candidatus Kapabacteria bacterium]
MTTRCPICGGGPTCPAGRYTPGQFRPVLDDEIIRAAEPLDGCALTHRVAGRYWCIPLVDAAGWRLVRMGTSAARRFSLHFGVRPTWVGQCDYALYVAPDQEDAR